jgi:hypothetical protein
MPAVFVSVKKSPKMNAKYKRTLLENKTGVHVSVVVTTQISI